jgi:hypothetical protein
VRGIKEAENQGQDVCSNAVLNAFEELLPRMTDADKEKLLAFGEGMALMAGRLDRGEDGGR